MPPLPSAVTVVEVGPRDGLQNEADVVTTDTKVAFIDALSASGLSRIEVTAFVSPRWVPQMADAAEVCARMARRPGVVYSALVPNRAGLDRAIAAGVDEVAIFAAASESFSRKNINQSIDESLAHYAEVCRHATSLGLPVRGYLSTCFGCPYEGAVAPAAVARVSAALLAMGVREVVISDTIGVAQPGQIGPVLDAVTRAVPLSQVALHLHDTRGMAAANVLAGLHYGVTTFDSAAGGLGGCPFAPGASGNLATEELLYLLHGLGIHTGVSLDAVAAASRVLGGALGRLLPSRHLRATEGRA